MGSVLWIIKFSSSSVRVFLELGAPVAPSAGVGPLGWSVKCLSTHGLGLLWLFQPVCVRCVSGALGWRILGRVQVQIHRLT